MKIYKYLFLSLFIYLRLITPYLFGADINYDGKIIQQIELVGLKYHNQQEVSSQLQSKEKSAFSYKTLQEDVQRLYITGFFASIDWEITPQEEGIKIIVRLTENEMVETINFEGFKEINVSSIKEEFKLKTNTSFNEFYLATDLRLIRDKYREKGYNFAEVSYRKIAGLKGVLLTYVIREGPYVKVGEVKIVGNKSFTPTTTFLFFTSDPILDKISTQPSHWYSSHTYNENELVIDLVKIENFYRDEGWFDADAFIENIIFNQDKGKANITIHIEEGIRYYVNQLTIEGNTSFTAPELLKELKIKEGLPYQAIEIAKAIQSIKRRYGKLGIIDCEIEPRIHYPKEGLVNITFAINEGTKKYLEKVDVIGNTKTKDKVIRRALVIFPTDLMDYEKIETSRDRIASTMYFQSVKYDIEDGSMPDRKNLIFTVDEARTGNIQFGGGYSANNGFGGMLAFTQNNFDIGRTPSSFGDFFTSNSFAGGGQRLSIVWRPGVNLSQFGVNFTEPYLFDKQLQLGVDYNVYERFWTDYTEWRQGEGLSLTKRFRNGWEIGMGTRFQKVDISDVEQNAPLLITELKGINRLKSLGPFIGLDKRNSWLYPTKGYRFDLNFTNTGGILGGDFDFNKTTLRGEAYLPLIPDQKKLILNLVGKFGKVNTLRDTISVPFFERFYAGGTDSVRGFSYRTISPKNDNLPIGGNVLNVFNMELTYPLYSREIAERPYDIIRFLAFYDAGNVVNKFKDLNLSDYRSSVGFGFRFYLSQIPISIYLGYPIKKQHGDERDTIQIDMGLMY